MAVQAMTAQSVGRGEPEPLNPRGMLKLAEWLVYCESIGWPRESMPQLERIWREYRNENGELR